MRTFDPTGDLNGDGTVGVGDYIEWRKCFDSGPRLPLSCQIADFNTDGTVGVGDFVVFEALFDTPPGPSGLLLGDSDEDGVFESDNCPLDPNPSQLDADNNGIGDACEPIGCELRIGSFCDGLCRTPRPFEIDAYTERYQACVFEGCGG